MESSMEALQESVLPAPCVSAVVSVSISFGGARQQRSKRDLAQRDD